ncbi:MarR family winged helix-turn-helix transcriptional regulator [Roseomonas sp. BN140053]|uniref:MarR family winged helix-turn-helix transcriptional regulator n=1 Tax=Roseomonas sp. BN140053 TaxID=3391898 RepID=UPI0039E9D356
MYRFSSSLPFLLARLGVRMGELFARELARDGLTLPMYRVLAALSDEGVPQRLGELAQRVSAELSTLSRLAMEMERRGLVTRSRPESDQRSLAVALAPRGRALAERLRPRAAHYEQVATGDLKTREAAALKATLVRVYENLDRLEREIEAAEAATPQPGPRRPRLVAGGGRSGSG